MIQMLDDIYTYVMAQASQRSRRIKCEKWSASLQKRYSKMLSMCLFITLDLEEDINRKRETVIHPSSIIRRQQLKLEFWQGNPSLFRARFRFRLNDFVRTITAMGLHVKSIKTGRPGRFCSYPSELCCMVVLRRLAFPCRFVDLVEEFGVPSNRLCDIFHATIDLIFDKYSTILELETWVPFFDRQNFQGCMDTHKHPQYFLRQPFHA